MMNKLKSSLSLCLNKHFQSIILINGEKKKLKRSPAAEVSNIFGRSV